MATVRLGGAAGERSVFLSYTRRTEPNRDARERLCKILDPQCRTRTLHGEPWRLWVDHRSLNGGDDWDEKIQAAMQAASLFVVVLSVEYLNSMFCMEKELPFMLQRRDEDGVPVLGIVLEDVAVEDFLARLSDGRLRSMQKLQCLPGGAQGEGLVPVHAPVWASRDEAWAAVAKEIRRAWPSAEPWFPEDEETPNDSLELKLPYWCDRYAQVKHLRAGLKPLVPMRRPLVLVHEAHEDDAPTEWVTRLALAELDQLMPVTGRRDVLSFGTPHYFGWPREPLDAADALQELCDVLSRAVLSRVADQKALRAWQAKQPALWWTHIPAHFRETGVAHAAEALGRLLSDWPHRSRGSMLVVVLNVVAARAGEDTGPVKRALVERLAAAGGASQQFHLLDLGALDQVTAHDLTDWMHDGQFGPRLKALRRDLHELQKQVGAGLVMREFVKRFDAWRGRD
jgi:TIR domain